MSARLSGRAKGTSGSVSITVNRHEELSDRSAPYADFGHGSLFEATPGARRFVGTAESPTKFLFKPFKLCMYLGGLHAYFNRRQASPKWHSGLGTMHKNTKAFCATHIPLHSVNISEFTGMPGIFTLRHVPKNRHLRVAFTARGSTLHRDRERGRRAPLSASAVSNSHRIRHFHTIAHPVSRNGSPERSPLPPRVVPVTGYTGLCADCLRAAVTSHGSRRRAASGSSSRHRRTSDESFMRTLARHASRRL